MKSKAQGGNMGELILAGIILLLVVYIGQDYYKDSKEMKKYVTWEELSEKYDALDAALSKLETSLESTVTKRMDETDHALAKLQSDNAEKFDEFEKVQQHISFMRDKILALEEKSASQNREMMEQLVVAIKEIKKPIRVDVIRKKPIYKKVEKAIYKKTKEGYEKRGVSRLISLKGSGNVSEKKN